MEIIKIRGCSDIDFLISNLESGSIMVDLSECNNTDRVRIMYFLSGATFNRGSLNKINKDQFVVSLE